VAARHDWAKAVELRLGDVERSLLEAEQDLATVATALRQLDPERATRELKDALRASHRGQTSPHVEALRRRHDTILKVQDRQDQLRRGIDSTLADVEQLAARCVELSLSTRIDDTVLAGELDTLRTDLHALELAHQDLRALPGLDGL
jgi:predicted RNase H-like nuclease (RuvC/YqgF family)